MRQMMKNQKSTKTTIHPSETLFNPNKTTCHKLCTSGNPNRRYLCTCSKCDGAAHGSTKITLHYLEGVVDCRLMDPNIDPVEWQRWHTIMQVLLAHKPIPFKRRKVA